MKRTYQGFRKRSLGVVQFDTTKNRFLAAGDDFSIKFWDMDNIQLLTSIDVDGGLPVSAPIKLSCGSYIYISEPESYVFLCNRQAPGSGSIKMVVCWLLLPMKMGLKFWQIMMVSAC